MKEKIVFLLKTQYYNFFIFVVLLIPFFLCSVNNANFFGILFLIGSLLSLAFSLSSVVLIVLIFFSILPFVILRWISFLLNFFFVLYLFIDFGIYRIYHFHFNGMVIGMITTPGFWDSVSLGVISTIVLIIVTILFFLLEYVIVFKISHKNFYIKKFGIYFTLVLLILGIEKVSFAVCDIFNYQNVTKFEKVYPLYLPLTIRGFVKKVLKININREDNIKISRSDLDYPKREIIIKKNSNELPNIVVIVVDSLRFDVINKEITPHIYNFSRKCLNFDNHYSGGNSTRFGIFSLFYGLYGYFWHDFLASRKGTVLFDVLTELGYDFKILSATLLTFPEFRKTVFIKIPQFIEDEYDTDDRPAREKLLVERFIKFRNHHDANKPYFSFLFFDAPHSRQYPNEFAKFSGKKDVNYLTLSKRNVNKVKNAYLNAVYFDDYLIGKLLDYLENKGDLKNTIIIITGDHGEEFYEFGHFGHNNSFDKFQVKVPFIVYLPNGKFQVIEKMTAHYDFVPTILTMLGVKNNPKDYSFGIDMFGFEEHDYVVSCNWSYCAIIDNESTFVFSYEAHKMFNMYLYNNKDYSPITDKKVWIEKKQNLFKVVKELTYFYK